MISTRRIWATQHRTTVLVGVREVFDWETLKLHEIEWILANLGESWRIKDAIGIYLRVKRFGSLASTVVVVRRLQGTVWIQNCEYIRILCGWNESSDPTEKQMSLKTKSTRLAFIEKTFCPRRSFQYRNLWIPNNTESSLNPETNRDVVSHSPRSIGRLLHTSSHNIVNAFIVRK